MQSFFKTLLKADDPPSAQPDYESESGSDEYSGTDQDLEAGEQDVIIQREVKKVLAGGDEKMHYEAPKPWTIRKPSYDKPLPLPKQTPQLGPMDRIASPAPSIQGRAFRTPMAKVIEAESVRVRTPIATELGESRDSKLKSEELEPERLTLKAISVGESKADNHDLNIDGDVLAPPVHADCALNEHESGHVIAEGTGDAHLDKREAELTSQVDETSSVKAMDFHESRVPDTHFPDEVIATTSVELVDLHTGRAATDLAQDVVANENQAEKALEEQLHNVVAVVDHNRYHDFVDRDQTADQVSMDEEQVEKAMEEELQDLKDAYDLDSIDMTWLYGSQDLDEPLESEHGVPLSEIVHVDPTEAPVILDDDGADDESHDVQEVAINVERLASLHDVLGNEKMPSTNSVNFEDETAPSEAITEGRDDCQFSDYRAVLEPEKRSSAYLHTEMTPASIDSLNLALAEAGMIPLTRSTADQLTVTTEAQEADIKPLVNSSSLAESDALDITARLVLTGASIGVLMRAAHDITQLDEDNHYRDAFDQVLRELTYRVPMHDDAYLKALIAYKDVLGELRMVDLPFEPDTIAMNAGVKRGSLGGSTEDLLVENGRKFAKTEQAEVDYALDEIVIDGQMSSSHAGETADATGGVSPYLESESRKIEAEILGNLSQPDNVTDGSKKVVKGAAACLDGAPKVMYGAGNHDCYDRNTDHGELDEADLDDQTYDEAGLKDSRDGVTREVEKGACVVLDIRDEKLDAVNEDQECADVATEVVANPNSKANAKEDVVLNRTDPSAVPAAGNQDEAGRTQSEETSKQAKPVVILSLKKRKELEAQAAAAQSAQSNSDGKGKDVGMEVDSDSGDDATELNGDGSRTDTDKASGNPSTSSGRPNDFGDDNLTSKDASGSYGGERNFEESRLAHLLAESGTGKFKEEANSTSENRNISTQNNGATCDGTEVPKTGTVNDASLVTDTKSANTEKTVPMSSKALKKQRKKEARAAKRAQGKGAGPAVNDVNSDDDEAGVVETTDAQRAGDDNSACASTAGAAESLRSGDIVTADKSSGNYINAAEKDSKDGAAKDGAPEGMKSWADQRYEKWLSEASETKIVSGNLSLDSPKAITGPNTISNNSMDEVSELAAAALLAIDVSKEAKGPADAHGRSYDWPFWSRLIETIRQNPYGEQVQALKPSVIEHAVNERYAGVPEEARKAVWLYLSDNHVPNNILQKDPVMKSDARDSSVQVQADVDHTYPAEPSFEAKRHSLKAVLKAYAKSDPAVGYCSAMALVAGVLVLELDEAKSLTLLKRIMFHYDLRRQYLPGMDGSRLRTYQFEKLLERFRPELAQHLSAIGSPTGEIAGRWFATCFAYKQPLDMVYQIYDLFLLEGYPALFKMALSLYSENEKELMACQTRDEAADFFTNHLLDVHEQDYKCWLHVAGRFDISQDYIDDLASSFVGMARHSQALGAGEELATVHTENQQLASQVRQLASQLEGVMLSRERLIRDNADLKLRTMSLVEENYRLGAALYEERAERARDLAVGEMEVQHLSALYKHRIDDLEKSLEDRK